MNQDTPFIAPVTQTPPAPTFDDFCLCVRDYEGKPGDLNYKNNNPFNFRCSPVGYLPKYGNVKCVNNFAVFPTYALGWLYGQNAIKDKIRKNPNWTILDYISHHAPKSDGNDPVKYTNYICQRLKVSPNYLMKNLV